MHVLVLALGGSALAGGTAAAAWWGARWPLRRELREMDERIKDVEAHFVVAVDPRTGQPTRTLDQVPYRERGNLRAEIKRRHAARARRWPQERAYLEATDGGRKPALAGQPPMAKRTPQG